MNKSRPSRAFATGFDSDRQLDDIKGLKKVIAASKTNGNLNLSNRQLQEVPEDVFRLPEDDDSVKWFEVWGNSRQQLQQHHSLALQKQCKIIVACKAVLRQLLLLPTLFR
jgi:hypothetical protein